MKVFHQAGHNSNWNLESVQNDIGDGIILSPVHNTTEKIESIDPSLKKRCLFDPQFYIPDSQKKKLNSYRFFPENYMGGFSTNDFAAIAYEVARDCLDYQIKNQFQAVIIPARYFPELFTDYIEQQKIFAVDPFLYSIENSSVDADIYVTLPLTSPMTMDHGFRTKLLNWITSYPEIDGVYLLLNYDENTKQIQNYQKLIAHLEFIREIIEADLKVICGYCNTEGLIFSLLDIDIVTIGAYENTRSFSVDKFVESDTIRQGPASRLYLPKLFNWIRYETLLEIKEDHNDIWEEIYTPTKYSEQLFNEVKSPHFTKPELYKHHFASIYDQYNEFKLLEASDKIKMLKRNIKLASELFQKIDKVGVLFADYNCKGGHLPIWNRAINHLKTVL